MAKIKIRTTKVYPYWASLLTALAIQQASMMVRDLDRDGWQGLALYLLHTLILIGVTAPAAWYWREFFRATVVRRTVKPSQPMTWSEAQDEQRKSPPRPTE